MARPHAFAVDPDKPLYRGDGTPLRTAVLEIPPDIGPSRDGLEHSREVSATIGLQVVHSAELLGSRRYRDTC
ncbi:MAG TPA: hypothetical protein PKD19_01550 [Candidatus Saccharibacteria bacterium]|jgi:hypothetical protein|nr:hypothetical protein [Candidatus Saccharibacteria bacterium]HMR38115.1 hypothetical protein [Candidatus Saccharibacteria bacterium]